MQRLFIGASRRVHGARLVAHALVAGGLACGSDRQEPTGPRRGQGRGHEQDLAPNTAIRSHGADSWLIGTVTGYQPFYEFPLADATCGGSLRLEDRLRDHPVHALGAVDDLGDAEIHRDAGEHVGVVAG